MRAQRKRLGSPVHNRTHYLVAQDQTVRSKRRQFTLEYVKVRTAHAAGQDSQQNFAWTGAGLRNFLNN